MGFESSFERAMLESMNKPSVPDANSMKDRDVLRNAETEAPDYADSKELYPETSVGGSGGGTSDNDDVDAMATLRGLYRPNKTKTEEVDTSSNDDENGQNEANNEPEIEDNPVSKQKSGVSSRPRKKGRVQSESVQIRDFPRALLGIARAEFPMATNNSDAIAAYVYVKSGFKGDVSDDIKELAKSWQGDKSLENMDKRLSTLENRMLTAVKTLQEVEMCVSYLAFDKLGYRTKTATDIRDIDFLETGMEDMMARLKEQSMQYQRQESIKNGRPIR